MKKFKLIILSVVILLVFSASLAFSAEQLEIVMVAKHEGISWFDDMRVGVEEFGWAPS